MENRGLLWIFCVEHVDGLMGQPSALWLFWLLWRMFALCRYGYQGWKLILLIRLENDWRLKILHHVSSISGISWKIWLWTKPLGSIQMSLPFLCATWHRHLSIIKRSAESDKQKKNFSHSFNPSTAFSRFVSLVSSRHWLLPLRKAKLWRWW